MRATGIVRRIDELGRVVIPKEIRRTMKLREGEELEVFTTDGESLILRKYSAVRDLVRIAEAFVRAVHEATGDSAAVFDRDAVIAAAGNAVCAPLSDATLALLEERKLVTREEGSGLKLTTDGAPISDRFAMVPVLWQGDLMGGVAVFGRSASAESLLITARTGANLLSEQF